MEKICGKANRGCKFLKNNTNCSLRKKWCNYQLQEGDTVVDESGCKYIVAFIEGLGRIMLDEDRGMFSRMFEVDEFPVSILKKSND